MEEKLAIDIFIQHTTEDLAEFKRAIQKGKMAIMRDLQMDDRFHPKRYVRYYLTVKILKMTEKTPIDPRFNISQERIERIHNAAITLDILEMNLSSLKVDGDVYCHFEMGGVYVLKEGETVSSEAWYSV
ncbi:hypothetical protein [Tepidibacillus marianensis]|uniref:hypothetical protein n=1 Tax=Tepidibacillus marianensis TaxID=3131995 RepID=UPI0030D44879